jgi:type I restriction enzyme M protein
MKTSTAELQSRISNIYNHLYANAEMRTPHGIANEVGKILHVAMFIEEQLKNNVPAFSFSLKQSKEILNGLNKVFAETIRKEFRQMNKKWKFYDDNEEVKLNDFDIAYTCGQLSGILVSDKSRDVFGDATEIFRASWAKQIGGQFFTDGLVTKLAMRLLEFDPREGDDLVDICAGTGGFLLAGLNHIREILEKENLNGNLEKELIKLAKKSLKGQEIDKEVCQVANATLASRIGKTLNDLVQNGDSLILSDDNKIGFDSHLCVASNPPFGTKITVKDYRVLQNFDLAKTNSRTDTFFPMEKVSTRSPDILFVEQNVKLLIPGKGRLSLVVPYQILSGPQASFIRNWLMKNTIIQSVIDLPSETFQPHTGTKTCLLTVKRREKPLETIEELEDYDIFMAIPKWIGHDRRGNPVYTKSPEGKQSTEILTDFPQLEEAFEKWKNGENPNEIYADCFVISSKQIAHSELQQLNAQFHKPSKYTPATETNDKWNFVKIEDVVKKIFYPTRFKRHYVDYFNGAIPFYGGSDIVQLFSWTGKWISPNSPKLDELTVEKDWLLITRSGSTGIVSIVPEAWEGYAMSEHIIRIVPDETKISSHYLLGFLRSEYCQEIINKGVFGSVIDEIDPTFIGKIKMPVPTSKKLYNQIIEPIQKAEQARNEAILMTETSLKNLNSKFTKEFSTA